MVRRGAQINVAESFAGLRSDYTAAKTTRFRRQRTGVGTIGRNADYHYRLETDFMRMLETARDIDRNDMVVGQGINRLVANVVLDGIQLDPDTGDAETDSDLKTRWREWGENRFACDAAARLTFDEMVRLAFRQMIVDGDIFALPLADGALQLIEAHRCRTPRNTQRNVVHGVRLDGRGRPREYWFTRQDIDPLQSIQRVTDIRRIPAVDDAGYPNVIHLFDPDRVSQTRGVTATHRITDPTGFHDDIQFAKLVQQQITSCFAIFRERTPDYAGGKGAQKGLRTTESLSDGTRRILEQLAPGMQLEGEVGEKLQGFSPNVPNPEFFQHAMLVLTIIAVNLDLPLAVLLLDPSQTNFSGWRGAIDQARLRFRALQRLLCTRFHREVYRWKIRQWIAQDQDLAEKSISGGIDLFAHKWKLPGWRYIEPLKDASADLLQQRNALNSPRRVQGDKGRDWHEIAMEIVEDNAFAIVAAKEKAADINGRFPDDPVHWRELISLPTPDGVTVNLNDGAGDQSGDQSEPAGGTSGTYGNDTAEGARR